MSESFKVIVQDTQTRELYCDGCPYYWHEMVNKFPWPQVVVVEHWAYDFSKRHWSRSPWGNKAGASMTGSLPVPSWEHVK